MTSPNDSAKRLLDAVAAHGLTGSLTELPTEPLPDPEWGALLTQVRTNRLAGHLMAAIESGDLAATHRQTAEAGSLHRHAMARVLLLEETLIEVVTVLDEEGIPTRVLKGAATAHLDYPDPALRVFGDVDLLVPPAEFSRAVTILAGRRMMRRFPEPRRGFDQRFSKGACLVHPNGDEVDLHRTLALGPLGLRVKIADLWADPEQVFKIGGRRVAALDPSLRLIHACYRGVLGGYPPRLVTLRDIAQLLLGGAVDPRRVRSLAAGWHSEAVLAAGLLETWERLQLADEVGLSVWARGFQPDRRSASELRVYTSPTTNSTRQSMAAIRALPRLQDKFTYTWALLFPTRDFVQARYPSQRARYRHALYEASQSGTTRAPGSTK